MRKWYKDPRLWLHIVAMCAGLLTLAFLAVLAAWEPLAGAVVGAQTLSSAGHLERILPDYLFPPEPMDKG